MTLRPHHLFCVQGYWGKGYDERFRETMGRIADLLRQDPDTPVTVVDGPDEICGCCPHLLKGRCTWDEAGEASVREHDAALMRALHLADRDTVSIREVNDRLARDPDALRVVSHYCSTCPWNSDCLFAQRLNTPRTTPRATGPEGPTSG